MTEKLFHADRYLRSTDAVVTEVAGDCLILDRTLFAPEAGGQPTDLGTINGIDMTMAYEEEGRLLHRVADSSKFKAGDTVRLELDWPRRFDHMQNHCAEHILSGIFKSVYDLDNEGFHLGDDIMTLDITAKELSPEILEDVETRANAAVAANAPITITYLETRDQAEGFPIRKPLKFDEDITIVTIEGIDCIPCCCPHPARTGEIGLIKLLRTEKYKGMTRIYVKCGMRALNDYRLKHDVVTKLNKKYSATDDTLLEAIKTYETKNNILRGELNALKQKFNEIEADALVKEAEAEGLKLITKEYETGTVDDLMGIAKKIMERTDTPVALSSLSVTSVLITHSGKSKIKCGQLVKEFAVGAGGKGGGNDSQARAIFTDPELMRNFVQIVKASV